MSDPSSAESSDDDSLLASPVFTKRDRRSARADKTKLDFLRSCVAGSDARADVHRKMAAMDEQVRQEEQEEEAKDNGGGGSGEGASDEGEAGPPTGEKADKGDENNDSARDEEGKENTENHAAPPSTTASANVKFDAPSTVVRKASTATSVTTATKSSVTNKQREEDYWSRVDSFAGALKTPGTTDPHAARRRLTDAVSGLVDYHSDATDDDEGHWREGAGGMTREQLRAEAEARSRGMSSSLGLRPIFRRACSAVEKEMDKASLQDEEGVRALRAFKGREEALSELKSMVTSLQKHHRTSTTPAAKLLRAHFLVPLAKVLRKAKDQVWDSLHFFLCKSNSPLTGRIPIAIPEEFSMWMWKMATSTFDAGSHCVANCRGLVRKFIVLELDLKKEDADKPSFGVEMSFLKDICMDDLVACLEDDFGLWLGNGPVPLPVKKEDGGMDGDASEDEGLRSVDVAALKNVFLIWMALLHRNLVEIKHTTGEESSPMGEDAAKALAALTRVGLDPRIHSADEVQRRCTEPLSLLLEKLTASLVRSVAYQIHTRFDDSHVQRWRDRAAKRMVDACGDLGAGDEEAADADDEDGHLPLAEAVKRMHACMPNEDFSMEVSLMKLAFAERALHECLDEVTDWEGKVKERMDALSKDWKDEGDSSDVSPARERLQHAMHALVTAEVGLSHIDEETESFMRDHAHVLAAVQIAGECALVGLCIFWRTQNDGQPEEDPEGVSVYAAEEKDTIYEVVSNIEDLCDGIKKECRAVIAYPHLRRAKEYLTRVGKGLGGTKGKSSKYKKRRSGQGSLDSYFGRPPLSQSDPFDDSQDS